MASSNLTKAAILRVEDTIPVEAEAARDVVEALSEAVDPGRLVPMKEILRRWIRVSIIRWDRMGRGVGVCCWERWIGWVRRRLVRSRSVWLPDFRSSNPQWTTDQDLRQCAVRAGLGDRFNFRETTFFEHKVNGKSRGTAYIEFTDPQAVTQMKEWLDNKLVDCPSFARLITSLD